jgi:acetyltransferase-like isoleucine patch superfamily enzyme
MSFIFISSYIFTESVIMEKSVIIYGIGKFAEYASYLFKYDTNYRVKGFCLEKNYLDELRDKNSILIDGYLEYENLKDEIDGDFHVFIAVGDNILRKRLYDLGRELRFSFANYISTKSIYWPDLKVGKNIFIGEGSIIQPMVEINDNTFIIGGRLGHHSSIGKHVLLSGSTIGGNSKIGDLSFLGLNAAVSQNVIIGERNIIGMNSTITESTNPGAVYTLKGTKLRQMTSDKIFSEILK